MTWTLQRSVAAPGLYEIELAVAPLRRVRREHVDILVQGVERRRVVVTQKRFHMRMLIRLVGNKLTARVVGYKGLPRVSAVVRLINVDRPSRPGPGSAPTSSRPPESASPGTGEASARAPIQLGAYLPGAPGHAGALDDYVSMVGRKPDIVMLYRNLTLPLLYSNEIANLQARGEIPLVSWEPYQGGHVIALADIAAGKYDTYIRQAAELARGLGMIVMIRFAYEMNLTSSPWASSPGTFISAWRHIVGVFRQEGADNVKWVWAPNVDYGGRPFTPYFPGDPWIDYAALDGYNCGALPGEVWQSLAQVFQSSYDTLAQLSTRPVIITETSSNENGGDKAAWIRTGFLSAIPQLMPRVQAVVWYSMDLAALGQADWRINSTPASLAAYRSVAASSLYGGPNAPRRRPARGGVD